MKSLFTLLLSICATLALAQDPVRVFISVDMEGISGIAHSEMTSASGAEYARGRAFTVADVNAAIEGAREAGATEFLVNDSHGSMRNVKIEELLPPTMLISNNSKALGMMEGISAEFDAVFFIGYHAMEGQPGLFAHTGSGGKVADISVNGRSMSEGGMNARVAGALVSPSRSPPATKPSPRRSRRWSMATSRPSRSSVTSAAARLSFSTPEEARHQIREGARRAIERLSSLRPTRPREPVTVAITYKSPDLADIAAILPDRRAYRSLHRHFRILELRARVQDDSRSLPQSIRVTVLA